MTKALAAVVVAAGVACASPHGSSSPAVDSVRQYIRALRANSARDTYDLLSEATRKALRYEQFARQWNLSRDERAWQIQALEASIKANPNAGERARVSYADGKIVYLERDGNAWRLETELAGKSRAKHPRDAIRLFARAIAARDVRAALDMLTERRRDGIAKQVEGFIAGLGKRIDDRLDQFGSDRAELRWDDQGFRYRIMLRKERNEWRIDDIYIRPAPLPEGKSGAGDPDGETP